MSKKKAKDDTPAPEEQNLDRFIWRPGDVVVRPATLQELAQVNPPTDVTATAAVVPQGGVDPHAVVEAHQAANPPPVPARGRRRKVELLAGRRAALLELRERQAVQVKQGVMVAFMLPLVARTALALPEGEPADDLHVTLAYLGRLPDVDDPAALRSSVADFAVHAPAMSATVTGVGRFTAVPAGDPHPVVALIDCPGLGEWRTALVMRLRDAGFEADGSHGFLPHVTLAYVPEDAPTPVETLPPLKLRFGAVTLALGPSREDFPLRG